MSTVGTVGVASLAAAVLGPGTLVLARRTMLRPYTPAQVEVVVVITAVGLLAAAVLARPAPAMAVILPLVVLGPAAAMVDVHEGRLPDALTGSMLALTLLAVIAVGGASGRALVAAAVATLGALALKAVAGDVVGWGDVKLIPTLGAVLGWHGVTASGILYAALLIAVTAILVAARHRKRATLVPYGPGLVLGVLGAALGL